VLLPAFLAALRRLPRPADKQLLVFTVDAAARAACRRQHTLCLARSGRATCAPRPRRCRLPKGRTARLFERGTHHAAHVPGAWRACLYSQSSQCSLSRLTPARAAGPDAATAVRRHLPQAGPPTAGGGAPRPAGGPPHRRRRRRLAGGRHGGSEQEAIPAGSERQGAPDDPTAEADEVGARDSQARVRALLGQQDAGDVQAAAVLLRGDDGALGARKATLEGAADGASAEAGTAGGGGAVSWRAAGGARTRAGGRGTAGRAAGAAAGVGKVSWAELPRAWHSHHSLCCGRQPQRQLACGRRSLQGHLRRAICW